ncbi:hypothetical protein Tco_0864722 [Tanacetum coccineum]
MSNTNNNLQTQTSNVLHNAIMEEGGKDRPPMLVPGNYVQWKSRIKRYIDTKPNNELIHYCLQTSLYKFKWTEKSVPVAEGSSETTTEGLKQGESINVQDLETNLYWEFGKFTSRDDESLELYYSRSQQVATRNRGKAIVNSPPPTYDQEPKMVAEDDEMSKEKEIDKLMALISLSFKKIYKPTNNNLRTSSNTSTKVVQQFGIQCYNYKEYRHVARECQKLKWVKDAAYHKEKMLLCKQEEAGFQLNTEQAVWRDDTDDEPDDQELEAHYMYIAQIQEVTPDAADNSGLIFDTEPLQKVQNDNDNYNVFTNDREHPEQPESVNDTYMEEQGDTNITIYSLDMSTNGKMVDQDDDLAK